MDVHPLGEGTAVGMPELGGDDAGRFFVGCHGRGQGVAQQVRMGVQPGAGGQVGEGAAGVVGVDRRAPLGAEDQVELDRVGWLAGLDPVQPDGGGLAEGQAETVLLAAVTAQRLGCGGRRRRARLRAEALLWAWLSPAQGKQYRARRWFEVTAASGRRHRILRGGVVRLDPRASGFCIEATSPVPVADEMLANKLLLETDERRFLATAHRFPYR